MQGQEGVRHSSETNHVEGKWTSEKEEGEEAEEEEEEEKEQQQQALFLPVPITLLYLRH